MDNSEFEELLGLLLDDEISDEQLSQLVAACRDDQEKRRELQFHLEMSDRLMQYEMELRSEERFMAGLQSRIIASETSDEFLKRFTEMSQESSKPVVSPMVRYALSDLLSYKSLRSICLTICFLVLLTFSTLYFIGRFQNSSIQNFATVPKTEVSVGEEEDKSVAMVTKLWNVEGADSLRKGKQLLPGKIKFDSGLVQIEFFSGARVVVEGPAELEILSPLKMDCQRGKLRALVPEMASGFTVSAPEVDIVDRGTEFAVAVSETGKTEVHVVEGLVELRSIKINKTHQIETGHALAIFQGETKTIPLREKEFVDPKQLNELLDNQILNKVNRWVAFQEKVRNDPRLLTGFFFQRNKNEDRVLTGFSSSLKNIKGAIVGCRWAQGRWPGKSALEFKRPGDAVRINVPGKYKSLTYSMWLRVDGVDRRFSSLLLTDKWNVNTPHWQIHRGGIFALGIRHSEKGANQRFGSDPIFDSFQLGNWIHLATVYDRKNMVVTHYVNGKVHKKIPISSKASGMLTIEKATIGNWVNPKGPNRKVRTLNGRIDELLLFKEALKDSEIREIFLAGRP